MDKNNNTDLADIEEQQTKSEGMEQLPFSALARLFMLERTEVAGVPDPKKGEVKVAFLMTKFHPCFAIGGQETFHTLGNLSSHQQILSSLH